MRFLDGAKLDIFRENYLRRLYFKKIIFQAKIVYKI